MTVAWRDRAHLFFGCAFGGGMLPVIADVFDVPLWWLVGGYVAAGFYSLRRAWPIDSEADR